MGFDLVDQGSIWFRVAPDNGRFKSCERTCTRTQRLTWRAPSSPRHACGLNVSFFLHSLQLLRRGPGWACSGIKGDEKACESLQEWAVLRRQLERSLRWILRGGSGKGLVFKKGEEGVLWVPYLLGMRANFGRLVMVRFEVSEM